MMDLVSDEEVDQFIQVLLAFDAQGLGKKHRMGPAQKKGLGTPGVKGLIPGKEVPEATPKPPGKAHGPKRSQEASPTWWLPKGLKGSMNTWVPVSTLQGQARAAKRRPGLGGVFVCMTGVGWKGWKGIRKPWDAPVSQAEALSPL